MAHSHAHAFSRDALFRQIGPLVGAILLWLLYSDAPRMAEESQVAVRGAALIGLTVIATLMVPWYRLPRTLMIIPPLVYVWVGSSPAFVPRGEAPAAILLLPMFWLASFGAEAEVGIGAAALAAAVFSRIFGSEDPGAHLASGFLLTGAAAVGGLGIQRLFGELRGRTGGLAWAARTDPLTGAANRRAWDEALTGLFGRTRHRTSTSVIMLDLDGLKAFNDRNGHQAGDRLLKVATSMWSGQLRQVDLLARLGGDEFGVLLPDCPLDNAAWIARRLCAASFSQEVTTSAGVAAWNGIELPHEVLARADAALYRAKKAGRNRVMVAGPIGAAPQASTTQPAT